MNCKKIAVDFDGVIHKYSMGWLDGSIYDEPVENAQDRIQKLIKSGYEVIIFTTRGDSEEMQKWLKKYKFPPLQVTNIKPYAVAYIDDRGIRFTNWEDIVKYFI